MNAISEFCVVILQPLFRYFVSITSISNKLPKLCIMLLQEVSVLKLISPIGNTERTYINELCFICIQILFGLNSILLFCVHVNFLSSLSS